jgi:hypothetical protein
MKEEPQSKRRPLHTFHETQRPCSITRLQGSFEKLAHVFASVAHTIAHREGT